MTNGTTTASSEPSVLATLVNAGSLTLDQMMKLAYRARQNRTERRCVEEALKSFDTDIGSKLSADDRPVRRALFQWALGQTDEAVRDLEKNNSGSAQFLRGMIAREQRDYARAVASFQRAADAIKNDPKPLAELGVCLIRTGRFDEARSALQRLQAQAGASAEAHFLRGFLTEVADGNLAGAMDHYERALSVDPRHAEAHFRSGYILDLRGEDAQAVAHYTQIAEGDACFVGALINLGLLHEDAGNMDAAVACFEDVVKAQPTNRRARLFLRDSLESIDMYYDEAEKQDAERLEQVLKVPVSDFELSVRSRNCLNKMNIRTVGDLVRKTESEMLSYKNFGETSLREIKNLLAYKGLYLGMLKDDDEKRARRERLRIGVSDNPILARPVTEIELSVRARKCMARLGVTTIGELAEKSESELLSIKNFGQTSLQEVKNRLQEMGIALRQVNA